MLFYLDVSCDILTLVMGPKEIGLKENVRFANRESGG